MAPDQNAGSVRRPTVRVALTVALFAVVVFAVDQLVPGARHRLSKASPGWLAVALGLELLACSSYVLLFQTVFSRSPWPIRLRRGTQIALGELGAFAITPTGLGGPAVRAWGLRAGGMPWRVLVVRSIVHGAIFNLPYVVAAAVVGLGVSLHFLPGHAPVLTALAPLALVVGTCVLAGAATWFARSGRSGARRRCAGACARPSPPCRRASQSWRWSHVDRGRSLGRSAGGPGTVPLSGRDFRPWAEGRP